MQMCRFRYVKSEINFNTNLPTIAFASVVPMKIFAKSKLFSKDAFIFARILLQLWFLLGVRI